MSIDLKVMKVFEENKNKFTDSDFNKCLNLENKPQKMILYPINEMKEKAFSYNNINKNRI